MKLTAEEFKGLLGKVILPSDDVVLVYSGIWTFGHRFREKPDSVADLILALLQQAVGDERTLMLPTYSYSYNRTRKFDVRETKAETGILPELFLKKSGVKRSASAISSFAVHGPRAKEMVPLVGESIWGRGSLVEWIEQSNVRIVTLGLPWAHSCGFLHRIEEVAQAPYRYYKDFPGEYRDETGATKAWTERMFVRPLTVPCTFRWKLVNELAAQRGQILVGSVAGVQLESCLAKDLVRAGLDLVGRDPYALVAHAAEVRDWAEKGGRDRELAELHAGTAGNDFTYKK